MKTAAMVLGIFVCLALPSDASESFILNIPLRSDASQETGRVNITLTLDGPAAGAQLVVDNATTLNLGQAIPVGSDFVRFLDAGNAVRIEYEPRSNFGADFCAGGAAAEKNIPMRFSGSQDVTEFRMSSFVVASPAVECSQPSRRVADTPASIAAAADGVAPALTAQNRGRLPLDIVLVLDKSGSMSGFPPGFGNPPTKADILKTAVQGFVANWRGLDQPAEGGDAADDRIGVVFFDSSAVPQILAGADPPANVFVRRGDVIPGPWQAVLDNIGTLTPGSATSIGGGINEAMKQWKADPKNDLALIVATDGIQNTAPLIVPAGSGFLGLTPVSGLAEELRQRFIPIQTIGFGEPDTVDETLLRNISLETSGRSYIAVSSATMFDIFALTLVSILKGNTASLALRESGRLAAGEASALQPVLVDRSAQRVVFSAQWAPPQADAFDLEVFPPGMTPSAVAATPTSSDRIAQTALQSFDKPEIGTWQVRVRRRRTDVDPKTPLPYVLNGFFLERDLDFTLSTESGRTRTGEPIRLRVNVSYGGKPLTRLPRGAVRIRVQRPAQGLGSILRASRGIAKKLATARDPQTALQRKVEALPPRTVDQTTPKEVEAITLEEKGRGVYVGTFDKTSVPGTYGFELVLDWEDSRTGRLRRTERLEQHVAVKADPAKSAITTKRSANGTVLVSVTPRDKFGNFLGPGWAPLITAKLGSRGTLVAGEPADRELTGTYVFTVTEVPKGETPSLAISVDGVEIKRAPAKPAR